MFVLELEFDDDQGRLAARPAHRERLLALHAAGRVVTWADDSGALLVFSTDRAGMDQILAADPHYSTPGVEVKALREWQPIVGAQGVPAGARGAPGSPARP